MKKYYIFRNWITHQVQFKTTSKKTKDLIQKNHCTLYISEINFQTYQSLKIPTKNDKFNLAHRNN